jgi:hypothetical protein
MIAVNKGHASIADFHMRWTTAYAQGLLDNFILNIEELTARGAICFSKSKAQNICLSHHFQIVQRVSRCFPTEHSRNRAIRKNGSNLIRIRASRSHTRTTASSKQKAHQTEKGIESSKYIMTILVILVKIFANSPKATIFLSEKLRTVIGDCESFMKTCHGFDYRNTEERSVILSKAH